MPAPGLFRSQFGSPPHPQSHRPAGAALQAAPTEPQNRAVRRGQRHHSGTGAVGQPLPCRQRDARRLARPVSCEPAWLL